MTEMSEKISDFFCNIDNLFTRKSHFAGENTLFRAKMAEFSEKAPNFCIKVEVFIRKHTLQSKNG